jgi:hypothetical protein
MAPIDALQRLVDAVRAAGGSLRRRGKVLWVTWGTLDQGERDALAGVIRRWKPDLLAVLDAETAATVFPGAQIVPCPTCGGMQWRRAGDGEVCVRCHPEPRVAELARRRRVA